MNSQSKRGGAKPGPESGVESMSLLERRIYVVQSMWCNLRGATVSKCVKAAPRSRFRRCDRCRVVLVPPPARGRPRAPAWWAQPDRAGAPPLQGGAPVRPAQLRQGGWGRWRNRLGQDMGRGLDPVLALGCWPRFLVHWGVRSLAAAVVTRTGGVYSLRR